MSGTADGYLSAEIIGLLAELAARLEAKNIAADIYIVGGAAIALEYSSRRSTTDIDAVFQPEQTVKQAAVEMAADQGLDPDWLNNAARAWVPNGPDEASHQIEIVGNLNVRVASPRYLLAMKLAAGRDLDINDIAVLLRALGISTAEEAVAVAYELYGQDSMQLSDREDLLLVAQEALDSGIYNHGP